MQTAVDKGSKIIIKTIMWILIAIYGFISIQSIIGTTHIDMNLNGFKEYAVLKMDNLLLTVILAAIFLAVIILIDYIFGIENINTPKLKSGVTIFVIAAGIVWVLMMRGYPVDDQTIVQRSAADFIEGNYSTLEKGEYLYKFPHQLGITFIFECMYRIFGPKNYQAIMVLNVIMAAGVLNNLFKILAMRTDNKNVHNMYWIMSAGCLQLVFYTFFVYGTIIGLFFMTGGLYLLMKYYQSGKYRYYILGFLALAFAIIAKSNFQIFLIAVFLVMIFAAIKDKKYKEIIFAFVLLLALASPNLIKEHYEQRSGIESSKGTPASLFIAMGLQEGNKESGCGADGWYNAYNSATMNSVECDYDEANDIGKENIAGRMKEFAKNPGTAVGFAFEKIVTQWNEPTFQTFWMLKIRDNHDEISEVADSLLYGDANKVLQKYMKIYLIFIWVGSFIYYYVNRKEMDIWKLLTGIVVIGGFIFHLFWEGKALYIMPYFVMSMATGSQGVLILVNWIEKKLKLLPKGMRENAVSESENIVEE